MDYFVLFFIHVGSHRVGHGRHDAESDCGLDGSAGAATWRWCSTNKSEKPTHLIRDNDGKYPALFDEILAAEDVDVVRTCIRAPNMNAYIERWIQSLQVESLDHFVVFGEDHFRFLVQGYLAHYNQSRLHQSLDNLPLDGHVLELPADWDPEQLTCTESLGGILKSYSWTKAAA